MDWETVIGLEVHVQLATRSKIFSGAATAYGAPPNTQACAVDLGLPGVLPVLNRAAVHMAIKFGLAIGAEIVDRSVFARKNYFYPDLPKGYQISQYERPIVRGGALPIELADGTTKSIGITRAHLEEDAGKSLHEDYHGMTGIDLNRAGTPLLEIVSEPELRSAEEAVAYARTLHSLVCYLGICDGNLQEGSFRVDANVSVRPAGSDTLGTRTELKNLNSFRFLERAIRHEVARQIDLIESGGRVVQETRLYDPERDETRAMRGKEEAHDYRYFPDPDLLPVAIDPDWIEAVRAELPELPWARRRRFVEALGLAPDQAAQLAADKAAADYFEAVLAEAEGVAPRLAANWVLVNLAGALNRAGLAIGASPVPPPALAVLLRRLADGTLSSKLAKTVFEALWAGEGDVDEIIERRGLRAEGDRDALAALVDEVVGRHPEQVAQYRAGKTKVLGFFVGQVMKATGGKADPALVNRLLRERLDA